MQCHSRLCITSLLAPFSAGHAFIVTTSLAFMLTLLGKTGHLDNLHRTRRDNLCQSTRNSTKYDCYQTSHSTRLCLVMLGYGHINPAKPVSSGGA
ncbi:unnamed protein product [Protopolystoma xenopodis]|uniref:Uncharacterized protein n=1 Tax=Protopolystoma xenopodis TaxID=117903 RepID=A0A3S4ZX56_9PLAT|nr:unnamed protein product [Protopolystoma xenopodis]